MPPSEVSLIPYHIIGTFQPKELMFNKTNDPHLSDDSHPKKSKNKKRHCYTYYIVYATIKKNYCITH